MGDFTLEQFKVIYQQLDGFVYPFRQVDMFSLIAGSEHKTQEIS